MQPSDVTGYECVCNLPDITDLSDCTRLFIAEETHTLTHTCVRVIGHLVSPWSDLNVFMCVCVDKSALPSADSSSVLRTTPRKEPTPRLLKEIKTNPDIFFSATLSLFWWPWEFIHYCSSTTLTVLLYYGQYCDFKSYLFQSNGFIINTIHFILSLIKMKAWWSAILLPALSSYAVQQIAITQPLLI